jgi:DNA polymerase-3 subunit epsilon
MTNIKTAMDFIAIDFETADYPGESACAVGLVEYQKGHEVKTFYSLIRPPALYIRPDFTDIHGLTVEDVKDAPTFADIWEDQILPLIGNLPLAAHNASFDMGVLRSCLDHYALSPVPLKYFCTLALSRKIWPELESHSLPFLGTTFGIIYKAHNALEDARTCGDITCMAADKLKSENISGLLRTAGVRMKKLYRLNRNK